MNLNYWFYGCTGLALVTGMANLRGASRMEHAFDARFVPAELDLRCMDSSALVILMYTFGACTARPRSWPMPTGSCPRDAWGRPHSTTARLLWAATALLDSKLTTYAVCRIDREGQAGYLAAG